MREQIQAFFKDPTCNIFFRQNSGVPPTLKRGKRKDKDQWDVRYQEKRGWIHTKSLLYHPRIFPCPVKHCPRCLSILGLAFYERRRLRLGVMFQRRERVENSDHAPAAPSFPEAAVKPFISDELRQGGGWMARHSNWAWRVVRSLLKVAKTSSYSLLGLQCREH